MAAAVAVNFGDVSMYSGGAFIPEGQYIVVHNVVIHQPTKKDGTAAGKSNLGVMVDFYPMANPTEEAKLQKFYSMGQKADESFAPNPETGKGIIPIPGAKGSTLNDSTNWMMYLHHFYQSGLPEGVFTNDISVLDGAWIYLKLVDEPESRKNMQSNMREVAEERKIQKVPVVSEILEGGEPWNGGGGFSAAPATPAPVAARPVVVAPKAAAKPVVATRPVASRVATAPAPPPVAVNGTADSEDLRAIAIKHVGDVIGTKPNGLPRIMLRTETLNRIAKDKGEDMANQVIATYFEAEGAALLASLVGELGYQVAGPTIKPLS